MVYKVCDQCGGVDEHPRHEIAGVIEGVWPENHSVSTTVEENITKLVDTGKLEISAAIRLGREFWDTTSTERHIDCCAKAGCPMAGTPDGCDARVAVWNGKTGAGMVAAAEKVRAQNKEHFENPDPPYADGTLAGSATDENLKG